MITHAESQSIEELEQKDLAIILEALFYPKKRNVPNDLVATLIQQTDGKRTFAVSKEIELQGYPKLRIPKDGLVRIGGGGIVFQCEHANVLGLKYALKVTRPSVLSSESDYRVTLAEYFNHAPLSHQNVARVIFGESLEVELLRSAHRSNTLLCPTMLMEWISGAQSLASYLKENVKNYTALTDLLSQCFDGLDYLHQNELIHWDIKSDNILVDEHGVVKITDLGNAMRLSDQGLEIQSSRWNLPPTLLQSIPSGPDVHFTDRRVKVNLPSRNWNSPMTDLWMLAKEFDRYLTENLEKYRKDEAKVPKYKISEAQAFQSQCFPEGDVNAQFAFRFLQLILDRILHPKNPEDSHIYKSAAQVATDIRKLVPEFGAAQSVPELQAIPQNVLRLPHSGNCPYTTRMGRVFNSKLVQRMAHHLQLATLAHVYPGAKHCRSEHAAGVMATVAQYVRALYADRTNPFWRISVERRDIDALLLGALLHDVGHIALGHFLEELTWLFKGRIHEDYFTVLLAPLRARETKFGETIKNTIAMDRQQLAVILMETWDLPISEVDSFLCLVAEILKPSAAMREDVVYDSKAQLLPNGSEQLKIQILHSIIDSAIDADKLDYLMRDAYHTGVQYAKGIDSDRFFQTLTTISHIPGRRNPEDHAVASIGVTNKGVLPVESILLARYQMFSSVYWHHTARAETAMLQLAIQKFIGAESTETSMIARLEELIQEFRERDDVEALKWLEEKIGAQEEFSEDEKELLDSVCRGLLGDRRELYWPIFELQYRAGGLDTEQVYQNLKDLSSLEKVQGFEEALKLAQITRQSLADKLTYAVKKIGGIDLPFYDGEILLDMPPMGKDQIENIFVWGDEGVRKIEDLSPIANAVKEAFTYWVRRPRVFLAPQAWKRLEVAKIDTAKLRKLFYNSFGNQAGLLPFPDI